MTRPIVTGVILSSVIVGQWVLGVYNHSLCIPYVCTPHSLQILPVHLDD